MNRVIILVVALLAVTVLIVWVAGGSGVAFDSSERSARFAALIAVMVLGLSSLILRWQGTASQALRYGFVWVALGFVLVLGYSYRDDFKAMWQRVGGELNPALPQQRSVDTVVLRRASDGHFYADVDVNGTTIRMLADTGASAVALSPEDAEAAGIDVDQLAFTITISTANGNVRAAAVDLDDVRVGSIVRNEVRAYVTRELSGSLLGMSFFNSLSQYSVEDDEMTLKD